MLLGVMRVFLAKEVQGPRYRNLSQNHITYHKIIHKASVSPAGKAGCSKLMTFYCLRQGLCSPGWPPTCPDRNHLSLKPTLLTVTSSTGSRRHLPKPFPTSLTYWPPEDAQGTSGSHSEPPGRCSCRHPLVSVPQYAGHLHPLERNGEQPEGGWN